MMKFPKFPVAAVAEAEGTGKRAEVATVVAPEIAEIAIPRAREGTENLPVATPPFPVNEEANAKAISFS